MFKASGRNDVILQWMSRKFLIDNKKEITNLPVLPGEQAIILKRGVIQEAITEAQIKPAPSLWRRFVDRIFGTEDVQLLIADTKSHEISIPFECLSSDRVMIRGSALLRVHISENDSVRTIRLLKENLEGDAKRSAEQLEMYREVTLADAANIVGKNVAYQMDTDVISKYAAEEINANRNKIAIDIVDAMNSKSPYWANFGLGVNFSMIEISDNAYDESVNRRRKIEMDQRELENIFFEASGNSEHKIKMKELDAREKANISMNDYVAAAELEFQEQKVALSNAHILSMIKMGNAHEENMTSLGNQHEANIKKAYDGVEVDRILTAASNDKRMTAEKLQLEIEQMRRNTEFKNKMEEAEFDLKIESARRKMEMEDFQTLVETATKDEVTRYEKIEYHKERNKIEDHKNELDAQVAISGSEESKNAKAAESELRGYKDAIESGHERNMESQRIFVDGLAAANAAPKTTIITGGNSCPHCQQSLDPAAKFCKTCGKPVQQ